MGMPDSLAQIWRNIRVSLRNSGIFRSSEVNFLIWRVSKGTNLICVSDIYQNMISFKNDLPKPIFPTVFWKTDCPPKMTYFSWLTFHNKNLSWENLKKRGWIGPSLCLFCKSAEESNWHMFWGCQRTHFFGNRWKRPMESHMFLIPQQKKRFSGGAPKRNLGGR